MRTFPVVMLFAVTALVGCDVPQPPIAPAAHYEPPLDPPPDREMYADTAAPRDGTYCGDQANGAAYIMEARQVGVPIANMMSIVTRGEGSDRLNQLLVEGAYARPSYSSEQFQREEIEDFATEQYLRCLRAIERVTGLR